MRPTRPTYQVDEMMCGSELPHGFDVEDFCIALQQACDDAKLRITIRPIIGSVNGARNESEDIMPDSIWNDTLCSYCEFLDDKTDHQHEGSEGR